MKTNYLKVISKLDVVPFTEDVSTRGMRSSIHQNGWWHCGILTNLLRVGSLGQLQILVQKRSGQVDIAKQKYDQSLASQMLYKDKNPLESFFRGIKEELGIDPSEIEYCEFLPHSKFYIVKKYEENKNILNRERIFLYVATLKMKRKLHLNCNRVSKIEWIDWVDFATDVEKNPYRYTKTARFFLKNKHLKNDLERFMTNFIKGKVDKSLNQQKCVYLYISPINNKDTIIKLK